MNTNTVAPLRSKEVNSLIPTIEAVLFSAGRGLTTEEIATITEHPAEQIELAIDAYRDKPRGLEIVKVTGRYGLEVKSEYAGLIGRSQDLSADENKKIMEEYLHAIKLAGRRTSTLKMRRGFLTRFLGVVGKPIDTITVRDIRSFLMNEEKRGNSADTIATKVAILQAFFKWLSREEIINKNPMDRIDKPKTQQGEPKYLTHEEIEQVREVCRKPIEKAIFELLYSSGARVSEALALNREDIDYQGKQLRIHDGKGGKARWAPLSTRASRVLEQYIKTRIDDNSWLLQSQFKKRMAKESIERCVRLLGERAGLQKRLTPHRLRHSLATHLLAADVPIDVVQNILGHSDISTTQIYAKTQQSTIEHHYRRVMP